MQPIRRSTAHHDRRGAILVLAAAVMVAIFAFTAFSVDLGYLALTKTQLQSGADATALGAALELSQGLSAGPTMTSGQVVSAADAAAVSVAQHQPNGGQSSSYLSASRDLRFGQLSWNSATGQWSKTYGVAPYNLVEATLRRDQAGSRLGDGRLPLYFAKTLGIGDAALTEPAAAGLLPGVGERIAQHGLQAKAISRADGSDVEYRFLFQERRPVLPVWYAGELHNLQPESVEIPASFGVDRGIWFRITQGVQGVLVRKQDGSPVVYVVTRPSTHYYQVMTRNSQEPILIGETI